jgi:PAS domain S-box-containing protein
MQNAQTATAIRFLNSPDAEGNSRNQPKLFDPSIIGDPQAARDLITKILESSTEYSVIATDLNGKIVLWNEGARRLYGYEPGEVVGKMNSSALHTLADVEAGLPQKMMKDAVRCGKFEGILTRRRKNGEQFIARVVFTPGYDAAGTLIGYLLISNDISKEAQYVRSLIEASLDPFVTISAEGKITDVNEATVKVTGIVRETLIGTAFSNYFTESGKAQEGYRQVLAKGRVTDYPLTIRHVNGALTDVLYNASVYRDEHENVLGVFAAARDVTVQKQIEAQLVDTRAKEMERLAELERFQKLTMGRELRMIELKKEIADLKKNAAPAEAA